MRCLGRLCSFVLVGLSGLLSHVSVGSPSVGLRMENNVFFADWRVDGQEFYVLEVSSDMKSWASLRTFDKSEMGSGETSFGSSGNLTLLRLRQRSEAELLQGTWSGTQETIQAGVCSISGSDRRLEDVDYIITAEDGGSLRIDRIIFGIPLLNGGMEGTFNLDGELDLSRVSSANCNGARIENQKYEYSGEFVFEDGSFKMTLRAREVWCPDLNCVFDVIIQLEKKKGSSISLEWWPFPGETSQEGSRSYFEEFGDFPFPGTWTFEPGEIPVRPRPWP